MVRYIAAALVVLGFVGMARAAEVEARATVCR